MESEVPMSKRKQYTAGDLRACLEERFSGSAYSVFHEVRNSTGYVRSERYIDAVVVSLWPSKGLHRMAFEIKVARSDFLRELERPAKNGWARSMFHQFWYIAPSSVVKEGELPDGVGWMKPHGSSLQIVRHARHNDEPEFDDMLLASLCRAARHSAEVLKQDFKETWRQEDTSYQVALAYQKAVTEFLETRNVDCYAALGDSPKKEVLEALGKATADKEIKAARAVAIAHLDVVQDRLCQLFDALCVVSFVGFGERDEAGALISGTLWGGLDDRSMREIRKRARGRRKRQRKDKNTLDVFEAVRARARELLQASSEEEKGGGL